MEKIKKSIIWIFNHKAFSISVANIILALILFIAKDPFGLMTRNYETAPAFFKGIESEINKFTIETQGDSNSKKELYREASSWKLKDSKGNKYTADEEKINQLLKALYSAKKFTIVTSSKEKAAEYGFNGSDSTIIELFTSNSIGKMTIGSTGASGFTYVKWNEEDNIYLIEDNLKTHLGRGANDFFINKKFIPSIITSKDINSLSLKSSNSKLGYELSKNMSGWEFSKPSKGNLVEDKINPILNKLIALTADEIILDESSISKIEKTETFEIAIGYKNNSLDEKVILQIFGKDAKMNTYFLRMNNLETIYKLNEYSIKEILQFQPDK
jgi:hypothetical protein